MELIIETDAGAVAEEIARRGADILRLLEGPLDRGAFRIEAGLKVYPAARSGSSYRRTGTLGRRWTTRPIREVGAVGREIGNNTEYAPFVQAEELQADVHRGRWQTDADVLRREAPAIVRDVDAALAEFLEW
jgi:hypothetical protein